MEFLLLKFATLLALGTLEEYSMIDKLLNKSAISFETLLVIPFMECFS